MLQTVLAVAGVAILVAILWVAREALMLVYVSALIAMGFSPLVKLIERRHARRATPGPALARDPPHLRRRRRRLRHRRPAGHPAARRAGERAVGEAPDEFNQLQAFLIRHRLMTRRVTLAEAVSERADRQRGNAVGTVLGALSSFARRHLRRDHGPDPELLPADRSASRCSTT